MRQNLKRLSAISLAGLILLVMALGGVDPPPASAQGGSVSRVYIVQANGSWMPWNGFLPGYSFANITTNTTTLVKTGPGVLHCITTNTVGTTSTVVAWNNTSAAGAKVASGTTVLAGATACYDIAFTLGLTIVTAGAAPADLTVSYR